MENQGTYSPDSALRDIADTRARTVSAMTISMPVWAQVLIAATPPVAGLGFVMPRPWGYVLPLAAIILALVASVYLAVRMERVGVQPRSLGYLRQTKAATMALIVGAGAFVLSHPLTDVFEWSPWVVPAVGLGVGLLWLGTGLYLNGTNGARQADRPGDAA